MYAEVLLNIDAGGLSTALAISAVSAQSVAYSPPGALGMFVLLSPTVDCFVRQGTNPTAVATGADLFLRGGQTYRVWVAAGNKIGVITSGAAGTCYLTPQG